MQIHCAGDACDVSDLFWCRIAATAQEAEAVHALPDDGARERVRRQLVHHSSEALGDLVQAASERAPGQGVVPEPANEAQKAERTRQGSA